MLFGLDVRRSERGLTLALGGYFFLVVASHYLIKPARNAIFLEALGADALPWVYIGTALASWWVMAAYVRAAPRLRLARLIAGTLALLVASLLAFWWWLPRSGFWLVAAFYIWVKIYGVLLPSQFWLMAEEILDPRQAKRLFGPIGAGGVLGSIVGSALAASLAGPLDTFGLLPLAALGLLGGLVVVLLLRRRSDLPPWHERRQTASSRRDGGLLRTLAPRGMRRVTGTSRRTTSPGSRDLIRLIAALLTLTVIVHTVVDWQFNKAAEEAIVDLDARTTFFGQFFTGMSILTLVIQLLATSWVLRHLGIRVALLLLPLALATGSVGILLVPGLVSAALTRGVDDALRYSIDQSARELLFLPVPSSIRLRMKPRIDLMASRVANGVGGVLILGAVAFLDRPMTQLGILSLAIIGVWIVLALRAREHYAGTLQRLLRVRDVDIGLLAQARLDADARRAIREGLTSADPLTVDAALDLAEHTEPSAFVDELRQLLEEAPGGERRRHVLRLLAEVGDPDLVRDALRATEPDRQLAAQTLAFACAAGDAGMDQVADSLDSDDPLIVTAAAVCLLEQDDSRSRRVAAGILERAVAHEEGRDSIAVRRHVARIIRDQSSLEALDSLLGRLLAADEVEVVRHALAAAESHPDGRLVAAVCRAGLRRTLRTPALHALRAFGETAVGPLTGILADPRQSRQVRQLAARALGRIDHPLAAEGLLAGVPAEDPAVRRASLKALNYKLRRGQTVKLDREAEAAVIDMEWREFLALHRLAGALGPPGTHSRPSFVATVVSERIEQAQERFFRALALRHPIQTLFFAYRGLGTRDGAARAHALELIDSTVERPLRVPLLRILEATDPMERARIAAAELQRPLPDAEEALRELVAPGDPWLAACAIAALGAPPSTLPDGLRKDLTATGHPSLLELLPRS